MKSTGLLKLALLSLVISAFWLSPAPGLEHPWDDDEAVITDSTDVLGGMDPDSDDGTGLEDFDSFIIFTMPSVLKPLGFSIYRVKFEDGTVVRKQKIKGSSILTPEKLDSALPDGKLSTQRK
jgi:hypothetical protein